MSGNHLCCRGFFAQLTTPLIVAAADSRAYATLNHSIHEPAAGGSLRRYISREGKIEANKQGVNARERIVPPITPPAMTIINGGQNTPPARIRGEIPPTVVSEVVITCLVECRTLLASDSPSRRACLAPVNTIMESLIASPIRPNSPMMETIPMG